MTGLFLSFCGAVLISLVLVTVLGEASSPMKRFIAPAALLCGASLFAKPFFEVVKYAADSLARVSGDLSSLMLKTVMISLCAGVTSLICEETSPTLSKCTLAVSRCALVICAFPVIKALTEKALSIL